MKHIKFFFVVITFIWLRPCTATAQVAGTDTLSVNVYFEVGRSNLDLTFRNNKETLDYFIRDIQEVQADSTTVLQTIRIETGASPEGNKESNEELARRRAISIRDYVLANSTITPLQIKASSIGSDWRRLEPYLLAVDYDWKQEALAIIFEPEKQVLQNGVMVDNRQVKLQLLANGECWRWLSEEVFPELRSAGGSLRLITSRNIYDNFTAGSPAKSDTLVISHRDTLTISRKDTLVYLPTVIDPDTVRTIYKNDVVFRRPVVALRSNLLLPALNLGVEVPLGNRWSVATDLYFPWVPRSIMNTVTSSVNAYCVQGLGMYLEGRFWLGRQHSNKSKNAEYFQRYRLSGHSIALVAGGAYFDGEWASKKEGVLGEGYQGEIIAYGIDYMYSLPLGQGGIHLDFDIALGGMYTVLHPYNVYANNPYLIRERDNNGMSIYRRRYLSAGYPIRAGISIKVPIFSRGEGAPGM